MDLVQPGEELEFYSKCILDLSQRGAEAIMTKREYIGDRKGVFDIFIFHLIYNIMILIIEVVAHFSHYLLNDLVAIAL